MEKTDIDAKGAYEALRARAVGRLDALGNYLVKRIRERSPDRTGELDKSYTYEVDAENALLNVGTELLRGRFVEIGTVRMAPVAPIRRTLAEDAEQMIAIVSGTE